MRISEPPDAAMLFRSSQYPYEAFLRALATSHDPESAVPLRVGLATLRLMDAWFAGDAAEDWGKEVIQEEAQLLHDQSPSHKALVAMLAITDENRTARTARIARKWWWRYAKQFEFQGRWHLAVDVYAALSRNSSADNLKRRIRCLCRMGHCLRLGNDLASARAAYVMAAQYAREAGDVEGLLRARIGISQILRREGDYAAGVRLLDGVIASARKRRMKRVLAMALHDRGGAAFWEGRYMDAIRYELASLRLTRTQSDRDRILSDIASALCEMQAWKSSRNVFAALAVQAVQAPIRATALISLIEIEQALGNDAEAARYERLMLNATLTLHQTVHLRMTLGVVYQRRGDRQLSADHFSTALALAHEHGLNDIRAFVERRMSDDQDRDSGIAVPSELGALIEEVEVVSAGLTN